MKRIITPTSFNPFPFSLCIDIMEPIAMQGEEGKGDMFDFIQGNFVFSSNDPGKASLLENCLRPIRTKEGFVFQKNDGVDPVDLIMSNNPKLPRPILDSRKKGARFEDGDLDKWLEDYVKEMDK